MNRISLFAAIALCACSSPLLVGDLCSADEQCDPGDACRTGECRPETTEVVAGGGIKLTPTDASVHTQPHLAPAPVLLDLASTNGASHDFSVACDPDATVTPATGTVTAGTPIHLSVQAATPGVRGTHLVTCTATSSSASAVSARITVVSAGFGTGGGGGSGIGPAGGTVDLLDFVVTGDTRPGSCDAVASYPTAIHQQIVRSMAAANPQFALDLGDHMYACSQNAQSAQQQMSLYTAPLSGFPSLFLMTMGNHECESTDCSSHTTDVNYAAFAQALQQVSKETAPNYALQIQTRLGRVTLVVVADNFFGTAQQAWLQGVLTDADASSIATLVAKHHPVTGSRTGPAGPWNVIQNHKYSLVMTAHNHDYEHDASALTGRSVICGLGGANSAHTGFCRVQQAADGQLHFTQYDATGNPHDTWAVSPR
ncbi:MAG: metallophosphoesterase [Myxococcales bacterium]